VNHFVNGGLEKYLGVYLFLHLFIFDIFEVFISFLTRCPFLNKGAGPAGFLFIPVATLKNNGVENRAFIFSTGIFAPFAGGR
jgi:hypothetical protein